MFLNKASPGARLSHRHQKSTQLFCVRDSRFGPNAFWKRRMEIKKKSLDAESVGASPRLAKSTRPWHLSSCLFSTLYSFYLRDFHQKPLLPSEDVSFVHMRGWPRNWDLGWSQVTVPPRPDFSSAIFHPLWPGLWYLETWSEKGIAFQYLLHFLPQSFRPKEKILIMGEE